MGSMTDNQMDTPKGQHVQSSEWYLGSISPEHDELSTRPTITKTQSSAEVVQLLYFEDHTPQRHIQSSTGKSNVSRYCLSGSATSIIRGKMGDHSKRRLLGKRHPGGDCRIQNGKMHKENPSQIQKVLCHKSTDTAGLLNTVWDARLVLTLFTLIFVHGLTIYYGSAYLLGGMSEIKNDPTSCKSTELTDESQKLYSKDEKNIINNERALLIKNTEGSEAIEIPDLASKILDTPNTETYIPPRWVILNVLSIPFWKKIDASLDPSLMITPGLQSGDCWPIVGSEGRAVIQLIGPALVSHVTMEHAHNTDDYALSSAPYEFDVHGIREYGSMNWLGSFYYDRAGPEKQMFRVLSPESLLPYSKIQLSVLSNHGNEKYTCLYRFQVHGHLI